MLNAERAGYAMRAGPSSFVICFGIRHSALTER